MSKSKIALFIDAENLTKWIKDAGPEDLLSDLGASGPVITRRAYGVWSQPNLITLQTSLNQLGFELIHSFHPVSGKNSTDIQMTVDVMEHALRLHDVEWFVLATGDSDFSPLFRKLREMGKEVIGVGPKSPLSECVKTSCSRYIYTDKPELDTILDYDAAADLVEKILENEEAPLYLGSLKLTLLNANPAFDEKNLGYSSFLKFVNSIGYIKTWCADDPSYWYVQKIKPEKNKINENLNKELQQPASVEMYTRILRKLNWRLVSNDSLIHINSKLRNAPKTDRSGLVEYLLKQLSDERPNITATEIRKTIAILIKAGLIVSTDLENNLFEYKYKADYRHIIDKALISRLISGCKEGNLKFDIFVAKPLLSAIYKDNQSLEKIYKEVLHGENLK